jgi:hypothetical protein
MTRRGVLPAQIFRVRRRVSRISGAGDDFQTAERRAQAGAAPARNRVRVSSQAASTASCSFCGFVVGDDDGAEPARRERVRQIECAGCSSESRDTTRRSAAQVAAHARRPRFIIREARGQRVKPCLSSFYRRVRCQSCETGVSSRRRISPWRRCPGYRRAYLGQHASSEGSDVACGTKSASLGDRACFRYLRDAHGTQERALLPGYGERRSAVLEDGREGFRRLPRTMA